MKKILFVAAAALSCIPLAANAAHGGASSTSDRYGHIEWVVGGDEFFSEDECLLNINAAVTSDVWISADSESKLPTHKFMGHYISTGLNQTGRMCVRTALDGVWVVMTQMPKIFETYKPLVWISGPSK